MNNHFKVINEKVTDLKNEVSELKNEIKEIKEILNKWINHQNKILNNPKSNCLCNQSKQPDNQPYQIILNLGSFKKENDYELNKPTLEHKAESNQSCEINIKPLIDLNKSEVKNKTEAETETENDDEKRLGSKTNGKTNELPSTSSLKNETKLESESNKKNETDLGIELNSKSSKSSDEFNSESINKPKVPELSGSSNDLKFDTNNKVNESKSKGRKSKSKNNTKKQIRYDPRIKFIIENLGLINFEESFDLPYDYEANFKNYNDLKDKLNKLNKAYQELICIDIEQEDLIRVIEFCELRHFIHNGNPQIQYIAENLVNKYINNSNNLIMIQNEIKSLKDEIKKMHENNYYYSSRVEEIFKKINKKYYYWDEKNGPLANERKNIINSVIRQINIYRLSSIFTSDLKCNHLIEKQLTFEKFIFFKIKNNRFNSIIDKIINRNTNEIFDNELFNYKSFHLKPIGYI